MQLRITRTLPPRFNGFDTQTLQLNQTYDVDLRWAPASPAGVAPSDLPDFFAAVQEQLWLRLQPARGPVDRLVIDGAERPE